MGTIWYQVYLYEIGEFGFVRAAKFSFKKIPVILKINVLFYFICNRLPFASKKNRLKVNLKLNNGRIVVIPQIGQNCFWPSQRKNKFSPLVQPLQNKFNIFVCPFDGNSQHFLRPCAKLEIETLELGTFNNMGQHDKCPIFYFKNHSTIIYHYSKCTHKIVQAKTGLTATFMLNLDY